jgi:hypothetical protein
MKLSHHKLNAFRLAFTLTFLLACQMLFAGHLQEKYIIYHGKNANSTELAVCNDLKNDIQNVTGQKVIVLPEPGKINGEENCFLVGTSGSSALIHQMEEKNTIQLDNKKMGARGGVIQYVKLGKARVIVLAGATVEGEQNTVYEYSKTELGIDPLSYWTGYKPKKKNERDLFKVISRIVPSSVVPVICYFENDVDELANMKKPYLEYDMETWKGMVNSLRRIHYNAIQLFDMLGRAEFFSREPYKKLRPNYHTNLKLVDSLIDYAHLKGMKIQIDLSPGYEMKSLTDGEAVCWTQYKQKWIDTWVYYLTQTPLGKADIFSLRPRNQVWDKAYVSSCGENKAEVFNEVYAALDSVLNIYKPNAEKLCICYDDGMEMFNDGFNPPKDFTVVWADDGYCDFSTLPVSTKGYNFGTYMHAGFWKNHTVHDPYPEKIDSVMSFMANKYNATKYLDVNGQTFRPFLLNLEAFSQWAYNPPEFNGGSFYKNWCSYYFGSAAVPFAIASMKALHQAQFGRNGYVQNLSEIKRLIAFLQEENKISQAGNKNALNNKNQFSDLPLRSRWVKIALKEAENGLAKTKDQADFYYDYIYLPALMYSQLLEFENTLLDAARLKIAYMTNDHPKDSLYKAKELMIKASTQLKTIYKTCLAGDINPKWATWYDPAKRRPNNGFPTLDMIASILANLNKM